MSLNLLIKKFKVYIDLIRPFTLLAPIIVSSSIMIASFFYNKNSGNLEYFLFQTILPASFALAFLNGASNTLNQITDIKTDKISKPYRPLPNGEISTKEALIIAFLLYTIALSISVFINQIFFSFMLLITLFTVTYSLPPRLKDYIILNQIWIGVPRGFLGILASWSIFGNIFEPLPLTIGIIAMLFLIGGSITKDIIDCEADKKTDTKTMVNIFGIKKAALMVFPLMFFPFAYIPMLIHCGLLQPYLWLLTFLAIPCFFIIYLMIGDNKKTRILENTSSWTLMYITYFVFASSFSILTVIGSI